MDASLRSRDGGLRAAAPVAWLAHGSDHEVGAPVRGRSGPAIRPGCLVAVCGDVVARGKTPDFRHVAVGLHEWQDHSQRARAGLRHLRVEEIRAVGHRCRTELYVVAEGTRCSLPVFAPRRARQQRGHRGTAGSHRSGRRGKGSAPGYEPPSRASRAEGRAGTTDVSSSGREGRFCSRRATSTASQNSSHRLDTVWEIQLSHYGRATLPQSHTVGYFTEVPRVCYGYATGARPPSDLQPTSISELPSQQPRHRKAR